MIPIGQGLDGQTHLAHGFEHVDAHTVEGRTGLTLKAAVLAGDGGAFLAQAAIAHGEGEIIALPYFPDLL